MFSEGYHFIAKKRENKIIIQSILPHSCSDIIATALNDVKIAFDKAVKIHSGRFFLDVQEEQVTDQWIVQGDSVFITKIYKKLRLVEQENSECCTVS